MSECNGVDIKLDRLVADLKELSKFGYDKKTGGIFRPAYSLAYKESVNWLISKMKDCGLSTSVDPVGNVIGRLGPRDLPAVICGLQKWRSQLHLLFLQYVVLMGIHTC